MQQQFDLPEVVRQGVGVLLSVCLLCRTEMTSYSRYRQSSLTHLNRHVFNDQAACDPLLVMHAVSWEAFPISTLLRSERVSELFDGGGTVLLQSLLGLPQHCIFSMYDAISHEKEINQNHWNAGDSFSGRHMYAQVPQLVYIFRLGGLTEKIPGSESGSSSSDSTTLKYDARKLQRSVEFHLSLSGKWSLQL